MSVLLAVVAVGGLATAARGADGANPPGGAGAMTRQPGYEFSIIAGPSDVPAGLEDADAALLAALEHGAPPAAIARDQGRTPGAVDGRIEALLSAGLMRRDDGRLAAAFPVIDRRDARWLADIDRPLVAHVARDVEARADELNHEFAKALGLTPAQTRYLSLIALSDVVFDRWQVRNVRARFLPDASDDTGFPPRRGGKQFYIADLEQDATGKRAALGFYSHSETRVGDRVVVSYGDAQQANPFGDGPDAEIARRLDAYVALVRKGAPPTAADLAELQRLGLVGPGGPRLPVIDPRAYASLPALAERMTGDLVARLGAARPTIEAAYRSSRYARDVSFQEFALWWYHVFYAEVTHRLIRDGYVEAPRPGYAAMVVAP